MTATCSKCGATKSVEDFPADRSKPSGRYPSCRECHRARIRDAARRRAEAGSCLDCGRAPEPGKRRCARHLSTDSARQRRYATTEGGRASRDTRRDARRDQGRSSAARRRGRPDARQAKAAANARRRARRAGCVAVPYDRTAIFERYGWACWLCGAPIDPATRWPEPESPSLDHVVPLVLGGPDAPSNVRPAHLRCNLVKHGKLVSDRWPETRR